MKFYTSNHLKKIKVLKVMYIQSIIKKKKLKIRKKIAKQKNYRLTVYKSNKHIYAQLFSATGSKVILSASSLDNKFKNEIKNNSHDKLTKIKKAKIIGLLLAKEMKNKNINQVVFDRSGFKFHGRIKAVADSIIECGISC